MADLPEKYKTVAKALIPYTRKKGQASGQMALISIEPALPCFLCGQPARDALVTPSSEHFSGSSRPWLTFPICEECEEPQIKSQSAEAP